MKIGFAGLSHLGIISSIVAASKGFNVIAYDRDENRVFNLNKGLSEYTEPKLKNYLKSYKKKIIYTSDLKKLSECDIVYISLDIKTDSAGNSILTEVSKLVKKVIKTLNKKAILVILSQVKPGFTRKINIEKNRLFYQVETLVFGNAINRAENPERIIIGVFNKEKKLNEKFNLFLKKYRCPILPIGYESAELSKISVNIQLSATVTATNLLSEICEKTKANWSEIIETLRLDKRIGKHAYISPGLGISGGNLERDIQTTKKLVETNYIKTDFLKSISKSSELRKNWVYNIFKRKILKKIKNPKICLLGLAYKANTNSIKNSPSIKLLKKIKRYKTNIYDPVVKIGKKSKYFNQHTNLNFAISGSDILIILTPWNEFMRIDDKIIKLMKNKYIIDPFGILKKKINKNKIKYFTLGESTI